MAIDFKAATDTLFAKTGAEELIAKVLQDPALLQSLTVAPKPEGTEPPPAQ